MIYEPIPVGRICRRCKLWKPRAELRKQKAHPSGVDALCRQCHRLDANRYFHINRDAILEKNRAARKNNPERFRAYDRARDRTPIRQAYRREYGKAYNEEHKDEIKAKKAIYAKTHPDVFKKSQKKWSAANRDKVNAKNRRYQKRHPENAAKHVKLTRQRHSETKRASEERRRARKRNLPDAFSASDYRRMMGYFNGCCAVCGRPAGLWHTIAQDHWIPLSDPNCPGTVAGNMIPLCHSQRLGDEGCNNTKWKLDPMEWLIKRFGKRKAKAILKKIQDYFEWVKLQP